jgi:2'-5' RNA ligase
MGSTITIGVVLPVPQPHAAVLAGWRRRIGDPEADRIPAHVTLLPPTAVERERFDDVDKHLELAATTVSPFTMRLFGTGTFRPVSPVVFVQVSAGIAECELLERAIRRDPIEREVEFPYHPHVTVGHRISDPHLDEAFDGLRDFVAQFTVDRFVLYYRDAAGAWLTHKQFELAGS